MGMTSRPWTGASRSRALYLRRLMNNDVTQLSSALGQGDLHAASRLLPLAYDELRRPAAERRASERPSRGLETSGLPHEAYLWLVGPGSPVGRSAIANSLRRTLAREHAKEAAA